MSTEVMSLSSASEPHLSLKRRNPESKRLHSPPKRRRLDGEESSSVQDDNNDILDPVLTHLIEASVLAAQTCADEDLDAYAIDLIPSRKLQRTKKLVSTMCEHLQDLDVEADVASEDAQRTLRQAYTLKAFDTRPEHGTDLTLITQKQVLESRGVWMSPAVSMLQARIDGATALSVKILRHVLEDDLEGLAMLAATPPETNEMLTRQNFPTNEPPVQTETEAFDAGDFDIMALARRAMDDARNMNREEDDGTSSDVASLARLQLAAQSSGTMNGASGSTYATRPAAATTPASNTAPTLKGPSLQEQYDLVRARAANRDYRQSDSANPPSGRRPWTKVEEDALMRGLDLVGGPHWAQILERFGENGTVSQALAGRNQVSLKDKARNLKYAFQKTGQPLPACLEAVTGELKKTMAKKSDV